MNHPLTWTAALLATTALAAADPEPPQRAIVIPPDAEATHPASDTDPPAGFRHFGDFLLDSRVKVTDGTTQVMPIKPLRLRVFTDGISIQVRTEGEDSGHSTFKIYRTDGIGRQSPKTGTLEVIPGVQAFSDQGGILRHLRLSKESLTITIFPGVSNQTIISTARAAAAADTPAAPLMSQGDNH